MSGATWKSDNTYIPLSAEMEAIVDKAATLATRHAGKSFGKLQQTTQDNFRLLRLQALVEAGKRRRRLPTFSVRRAIKYASAQFGELTGEDARVQGLDLLVELRGMAK